MGKSATDLNIFHTRKHGHTGAHDQSLTTRQGVQF